MPIFKITIHEEIEREGVAFVEAPDERAAHTWAVSASSLAFRESEDFPEKLWESIKTIEQVEKAPKGWKVLK
jgi:hypothetical protein